MNETHVLIYTATFKAHVFGDDAVNGDEHRGLGFMVRGTGSATIFIIVMPLVYFCINTAGLAEVNGKQVPKQRKIYAFRSKLQCRDIFF
uniref:Uncharacterized protein n=1 Tax=Glossina palpalis gambiensis TaxID=67801 RepID=A0A1B0AYI4_9MUSC